MTDIVNELRDIAEKIDNIGSGSGGGTNALIVHETVTGDQNTLDKTWQEIYDAMSVGRECVLLLNERSDTGGYVARCQIYQAYFYDGNTYGLSVDYLGSSTGYLIDDPSGYPTHGSGVM